MAGRLQDKIAIVFGAGSVGPGWGNGKATAVVFAREGAQVTLFDVSAEKAAAAVAELAAEGLTVHRQFAVRLHAHQQRVPGALLRRHHRHDA